MMTTSQGACSAARVEFAAREPIRLKQGEGRYGRRLQLVGGIYLGPRESYRCKLHPYHGFGLVLYKPNILRLVL